MLGGADVIRAVVDSLTGYTGPIVVDPVMVAKREMRCYLTKRWPV